MSKKKFHYAWVIMIACFIILMNLMGLVLAVTTVFLKPVSEALGLSRTQFSSYTLVHGILGMVASMFAGPIIKKLGVRKTVLTGTLMVALSLVGYSRSSAMWHFWIFGAICGFGAGFSAAILCSVLLNNWFKAQKGLATSIAFMGTTIGNLVYSRLAGVLLEKCGWRMSYVIFAGIVLVVTSLVGLFLVEEFPKNRGLAPYGEQEVAGSEALGTVSGVLQKDFLKAPPFYLMALSFLLNGVVIMGVQNHLLAYLSDIGYATAAATNIYTILLVVQMGGKLLLGAMVDRFGVKLSMLYIFVTYVLAIVGFLFATSTPMAIMGAIGLGLAAGVCTIIPPILTGQLVGNRDFAGIFGSLNVFNNLGISLSTICTSLMYDTVGYRFAWIVYLFGMFIITACVFLSIRTGRNLEWKEE